MCKWYCTSTGPSTNLKCLSCGSHYCAVCLHGEAGKMPSLIKCASCGHKPTVKPQGVKPSADRGPRAEGAQHGDAGVQRLAVTTESSAAIARPGSQGAGSRKAGPERFFYDRSTYTGTHVNGGPERVAKGGGTAADQAWKRPTGPTLLTGTSQEKKAVTRTGSRGSLAATTTSMTGTSEEKKAVDSEDGAPSSAFTKGLRLESAQESDATAQRLAVATEHSAAAARPGSHGAGSRKAGPERFFYDRSTYTGTHVNGGPERVAKGGGTAADQAWKRPTGPTLLTGTSQEKNAVTRTGSRGSLAAATTPMAVTLTRPSSRGAAATPARPSSRGAGDAFARSSSRGVTAQRPTTELKGPERFFYDKSSYTGTHTRGGPAAVAKGGGTSADQSWKRR